MFLSYTKTEQLFSCFVVAERNQTSDNKSYVYYGVRLDIFELDLNWEPHCGSSCDQYSSHHIVGVLEWAENFELWRQNQVFKPGSHERVFKGKTMDDLGEVKSLVGVVEHC